MTIQIDFLRFLLSSERLTEEEICLIVLNYFSDNLNRLLTFIDFHRSPVIRNKSSKLSLMCKKLFPRIFIDLDLKYCI